MKRSLLQLLRSPDDGSELRLVDEQLDRRRDHRRSPRRRGGREFPIESGLPLFAADGADDPTFAFKWSIIGDTYGHEQATRATRRAWYLERFGYGDEETLAEAVGERSSSTRAAAAASTRACSPTAARQVVAVDLSREARGATYRQAGAATTCT